jgi:hypothetical protein
MESISFIGGIVTMIISYVILSGHIGMILGLAFSRLRGFKPQVVSIETGFINGSSITTVMDSRGLFLTFLGTPENVKGLNFALGTKQFSLCK